MKDRNDYVYRAHATSFNDLMGLEKFFREHFKTEVVELRFTFCGSDKTMTSDDYIEYVNREGTVLNNLKSIRYYGCNDANFHFTTLFHCKNSLTEIILSEERPEISYYPDDDDFSMPLKTILEIGLNSFFSLENLELNFLEPIDSKEFKQIISQLKKCKKIKKIKFR